MWWPLHGSEMACLCFLTHGCLPTPVAGFFILVRKEALVRGGKITAGRKKNGEQLLRDLGMGEGGHCSLTSFSNDSNWGRKKNLRFPRLFNCSHEHDLQMHTSQRFLVFLFSHSPGLQQFSLSLILGSTVSQGHTIFIQLSEFFWIPGTSLVLLLCLYFSTPCLKVSKSLAVRPQHTICASHTNTGHGGGKEETQTPSSS